MGNTNKNREGFEESLRRGLNSAEVAPSPHLWERVEASLASQSPVVELSPRTAVWRRIATWGSVAAASLLVALASNLWFGADDTVELSTPYIAHIAHFEPLAPAQIAHAAPTFGAAQRSGVVAAEEVALPQEVALALPSLPLDELAELAESAELAEDLDTYNHSDDLEDEILDSTEEYAEDRTYIIYSSPEPLAEISPRRHPLTLALGASSGGGNTTQNEPVAWSPYALSTSPDGYVSLMDADYDPAEVSHRMPISYSLMVSYGLSERWSVESGVSYTRLLSDVTMPYASASFVQQVEFVGLPLRLNYDIYNSRYISLYAAVGGELERCVGAKINGADLDERTWHSSLHTSLGVQYNLGQRFGLYCEPELNYYLNPTTLTTLRSERPLSFALRVGLRFSL